MKKILVLIALSFMTVSTLTAQMKDPQNWVGYEEIMGVKNGLRFYDFDVNLIESSDTSFVMERKESPMIFGCPR